MAIDFQITNITNKKVEQLLDDKEYLRELRQSLLNQLHEVNEEMYNVDKELAEHYDQTIANIHKKTRKLWKFRIW